MTDPASNSMSGHPVTRTLSALLALGGVFALAGYAAQIGMGRLPDFVECSALWAPLGGTYLFGWYAIHGGKRND